MKSVKVPASLVAVAMLLGSTAAKAEEQESAVTLGYQAGWYFMGGLTTGGSSTPAGGGGYLGGEASFVRLRQLWWNGFYVDGAYDFGRGNVTVTAGPEVGWSVLGVDGGVGVRAGDDGVELGPHVRGLLTFGVFSLYARYGYWPDSDEQRHVRQYGVLLKFPLALPWGFGPSAPWDMGDRARSKR